MFREWVVRKDYNLDYSNYVTPNDLEEFLPLERALVELCEAEEEKTVADERLQEVLGGLELNLTTPNDENLS